MPTSHKAAIAIKDSTLAEPSEKTASTDQESGLISSYDLHLFNEGKHTRLYEKFGAHITEIQGQKGTYFAVWAPDAMRISIVGDFNAWNPDVTPMNPKGSSGRVGLLCCRLGPRRGLQILHPFALSRILRCQG